MSLCSPSCLTKQSKGINANNDAQGIIIHIQGNSKDTDIFLEQLKSQAPVLSKIENIEIEEYPMESFNDFQIKRVKMESIRHSFHQILPLVRLHS